MLTTGLNYQSFVFSMKLALTSLCHMHLCLYFICYCKITNKVSESLVQISMEKNLRGDQVKYGLGFLDESYKIS